MTLAVRNDVKKQPYVLEAQVDFAEAATAKGSALAASDVIAALSIPAETMVLGVWLRKDTATTGTATDVTIDLGVTGGDVDQWVDGFDLDGASAGAYAASPTTAAHRQFATADTIDILIATMTGTLLTGKVTVGALCIDMADRKKLSAGTAQSGS